MLPVFCYMFHVNHKCLFVMKPILIFFIILNVSCNNHYMFFVIFQNLLLSVSAKSVRLELNLQMILKSQFIDSMFFLFFSASLSGSLSTSTSSLSGLTGLQGIGSNNLAATSMSPGLSNSMNGLSNGNPSGMDTLTQAYTGIQQYAGLSGLLSPAAGKWLIFISPVFVLRCAGATCCCFVGCCVDLASCWFILATTVYLYLFMYHGY